VFLGLGFRIQGSGFRAWVSGLGVQGSGFRVQGAGVQGSLDSRLNSTSLPVNL